MTKPVATVILPTFNHGATLRFALESALAQTVPVEVFIIGDGVPDADKTLIRHLASNDARVRFFDHPKHVSRGEPYRHEALQSARGTIVCYLCDRDLWFPDHVAKLAHLLKNADFAHAIPLQIMPGDQLKFFPTDLSLDAFRHMMLAVWNRVPFSAAAHTLAFYRRLEIGWETTPPGVPTDWHFFRKFLAHDDCRCVSSPDPTAITFPSPPRLDWNVEQRLEELTRWRQRIDTDAKRKEVTLAILKAAIRDRDRVIAKAYMKLYGRSSPAPADGSGIGASAAAQ